MTRLREGKNLDVMMAAFKASKSSGKPWQIWAANTMMGHYVLPDFSKIHLDVNEAAREATQGYFHAVLSSDQVPLHAR